MQALASGVDERAVSADREEKSISAEETYATDIRGLAEFSRRLVGLADRTASRLRAADLVAARVTVKIRRADFTTYTRQRVLAPATQDTAAIAAQAQILLAEWSAGDPDAALRLLGVGVTDLTTPRQADLFRTEPPKEARLDSVVDGIRDRFGKSLVKRASQLPRPAGGGPRSG